MTLSPMYAAILQDLNKAVAQSQPEDVLQFCANWFNSKLEEQRRAGRANLAQAEQQYGSSNNAGGLRSKSVSTTAAAAGSAAGAGGLPASAIRKKGSLPSLVGQGYTFGSSGKTPPSSAERGERFMHSNMPDRESDSAGPSPYSEVPPNLRIPPMPNLRNSAGAGSNNNNNNPMHASAPPSAASAGSGINWNRSFGSSASQMLGNDMHDSDEENMPSTTSSSRQNSGNSNGEGRDRLGALPSSMSSNNGIPASYNLGRRTSVSAESIDPNSLASAHPLPKIVIPKTASQKARIEQSIEKNLLFRNLDEDQHVDVLNAMKEVKISKGTEVIVQGAVGDFFYVVESGEFKIWVRPQSPSGGMVTSPVATAPTHSSRGRSLSPGVAGDPESQDDGTIVHEDGSVTRADGSKLVATIAAGGSFGELALMYNAPRAATVTCSSNNATLWALDRVTFRTILMEHTFKKRKLYEKFLAEVPILLSLENYERSKIADALEERIYEEGEDVVREGELGKNFYIIESGRAEVLKKKGDKIERVGTLSKGDYFGELALLNSAPRAATVRPLPGSGRLRVATLGEKAFTRLLGPVVEILTRRAERNYGNTGAGAPQQQGGLSSSTSTTPTPLNQSTGRGEKRDSERESGIPLGGNGGGSRKVPSRTGTPSRRHREESLREDTEMAD